NVKQGDYILAVNGIAMASYPDPYAPFEGLAGKTVELTVNSKPSWDGARKVVVKTLGDETRLRNLAWIEANRKRVDEASGGKIGELTVNIKPSWDGTRNVLVKNLDDSTRMCNLAWIDANRKCVDEASGGKIGYIYLPSTRIDGQNELIRQFYGKWHKEGLIID